MTDTLKLPAKKKRSLVLPIALAIIVVALLGFVASRAGIDKLLVKTMLDGAIEDLKKRGVTTGRDINVTYGDLEVVGSFTNKHVVVHHPVITIKPLKSEPLRPDGQNQIDALTITTPVAEIYPESMDFSALRVALPQPINFAGTQTPDKSLLKITSNTPVVVTVNQTSLDNTPRTQIRYVSPTEMDFTYLREQQAAGAEEETPTIVPVYETLRFNVAAGSGFESDFTNDANRLGKAKIYFNEMTLTPQSATIGAIQVAQLSGEWNHSMNEKKNHVIHVNAALGPVTAAPELLPYAPISAALDVSYEGAMTKTPESIASLQSASTTFDLKTFSITTKEAALGASGNFVASAADVLPVGAGTLNISNVPFVLSQLRKHELLKADVEPHVALLGEQITGTPIEQLTDASIIIERQRGSSFKIGKTTFEELLAAFLKQAMQPQSGKAPAATAPASAAPSKPAADKAPAANPTPILDNSVRG